MRCRGCGLSSMWYVFLVIKPDPGRETLISTTAPPLHIRLSLRAPHALPNLRLLLPLFTLLLLAPPPLPRPQHNADPGSRAPPRSPHLPNNHIFHPGPKHNAHLRPRLGPAHADRALQPPQHPRPWDSNRRRPIQQGLPRPRLEPHRSAERTLADPVHSDLDTALPQRD